ncbi:hypothetical protein SMB34_03095 [Thalassospira permensis NBRC 106175]|uniref:Uncharacterized protein n=1 Tax=Thalassospira permensis NBRC 106175 TaxID=1353532 RepID=A0ABR4TPZ5_9PROT|nr:hypothetical protein SMB34_03095 [Thalassospira permensis NBRC 106175]
MSQMGGTGNISPARARKKVLFGFGMTFPV